MRFFYGILSFILLTSFSVTVKAATPYFYDTTGKTIFLNDFRGKPTVLFVYKKTCAICMRMLVELDKFKPKIADDFNVITVMIEKADVDSARKIFIKKDIRTLPIYLDKDNVLTEMLGFHVTPMTIMINDKGVVTKKVVGSLDWSGPFFADELKELKNYGKPMEKAVTEHHSDNIQFVDKLPPKTSSLQPVQPKKEKQDDPNK